jgi:hypothetical protein
MNLRASYGSVFAVQTAPGVIGIAKAACDVAMCFHDGDVVDIAASEA